MSLGVLWSKPTATIYIHKNRYSKQIFDTSDYFSICFFDETYADEINYFGTVSGRNENKIEKCGLEVSNQEVAPYFKESKVAIICKKMGQGDFDVSSVDDSVKDWYTQKGVI